MSRNEMQVVRLPHGIGLDLPDYATKFAAGMDLRAACDTDNPIILQPAQRALIPTGMVFELPEGYEGQVRPRSGMALNHGITCLNTPGTIDSDYRGEVMVLLINHSTEAFTVTRGMRIAQLVVAPVTQVTIKEIDLASSTERGSGGFGSTGQK